MTNNIEFLYVTPGYVSEGYVTTYKTQVISHLDLANKRIHLNPGITEYHPVDDIYREVRFIRSQDASLRGTDMPVTASGNLPKGGGNFTPRLATFNNGWRIVPHPSTNVLYISGEQITDDGQSGPAVMDLDALPSDNKITIHYEPPAAELIVASVNVENLRDAVWNALLAEFNSVGTFGHKVSSIAISEEDIANSVWNAEKSSHSTPNTFGEHLSELTNSPEIDEESIAEAVWDRPIDNHIVPGTTGATINNIETQQEYTVSLIEHLLKYSENRTKVDTVNKTLTIFDDDGTTPIKVFSLRDSNGNTSVTEIAERIPQ